MIEIKVPATTSNIGPGFDCLGIALDLYNTFSFEPSDQLRISGCPKQYCTEDNLVYRAYAHAMQKIGKPNSAVAIHCAGDIPISRGLGSSATCILAGVMAANVIGKANLSNEQILELALQIENHPDNLAPALYGGMVVSIIDQGKAICEKISLRDNLAFVAFVPDYELSTEKSRAVLPKNLSYQQTVFNVGRSAMLITALLNGRYQLLRSACDDAIHQPFRKSLIPHYDEIEALAYQKGAYAFYLSGAGSTMMALCDAKSTQFDNMTDALPKNWQCFKLTTASSATVSGC